MVDWCVFMVKLWRGQIEHQSKMGSVVLNYSLAQFPGSLNAKQDGLIIIDPIALYLGKIVLVVLEFEAFFCLCCTNTNITVIRHTHKIYLRAEP